MVLTDVKVKTAKSREKPHKLTDSGGMYLLINANSSEYWRTKHRLAGKGKMLSIGIYSDATFAGARGEHNEAREILVAGGDPDGAEKEERIALQMSSKNIFEAAVCEWYQLKVDRWLLRYCNETIDISEKGIFPHIGKYPITEIKPVELLGTLRKMKKCGALERMRKVRQCCGKAFRYATVTGRADYNPVPDPTSALVTSKKVHFPFLTVNKLPHFPNGLTGYTGNIITKAATQIIVLAGVRMQELRPTCWKGMDFETKLWKILAEAMRVKRLHVVPLSKQVITLFKRLEPISKYHPLAFIDRSNPRKSTSKESINQAIKLLGYKGRLTGHGFRHTMSTIPREKGFSSAWIET